MESPLHPPSRIFPTRGVVSFIPFHSFHAFIHSSRGLRRSSSRSSSVVDVVAFVEEEDRDGTRRPTRAFVGGDGSLSSRVSLSLSSCLSLAMSLSRSRARARHRRRVRVLLSVLERVLERAHASTHARTNARIHPFMHPFMHPRIIGADIATTSRMDLEGCATRDVVTRRRRASRDARERGEREERGVDLRIARPRTTTGDDAATSIRFDSISSFDFDLI